MADGEVHVSLLPASEASEPDHARHISLAFKLSWAVNWLLLALKVYAFAVSSSKAVLASMADSAVDLASQLVLSVAERSMSRYHPGFPIGRGKLEALAVIACACIMSIASLEVAQFSALDLYNGFAKGEIPHLDLSPVMFAILLSGTVLKLGLYFYCNWLKRHSDSMEALAEDHINDVASNLGAIGAAVVTKLWPEGWWVDGVAAIVIALVILARWSAITHAQASCLRVVSPGEGGVVLKIVGQAAPEAFRQKVEQIAASHHPSLLVDITRAYHFGSRFNVEQEVVLPADMTVEESHDIALALQHKLEALDEVERAFVHVDYQQRGLPEHKVERNLLSKYNERQAALGGHNNHSP
ncbi:hypothetical protein N2152v2_006742 [Parachlorella kessleri]